MKHFYKTIAYRADMTGHEALMSARFSYVLYHPDHKVREQFEHLLKHSGQNLTVDPYHDNCGNPIAEGHPHYEASLAFIGFSQGERTTMR